VSIDRQYGVHELPGTEQPAPAPSKTTVSAGFELTMRGYVNAIWARLSGLEGRIDGFEAWRADIAEALKEATGIDPGLSSPAGEAEPFRIWRGRERIRPPSSPRPSTARPSTARPSTARPWEVEGVSRRTWFRRRKEGAP
jgi:hypothetical protein